MFSPSPVWAQFLCNNFKVWASRTNKPRNSFLRDVDSFEVKLINIRSSLSRYCWVNISNNYFQLNSVRVNFQNLKSQEEPKWNFTYAKGIVNLCGTWMFGIALIPFVMMGETHTCTWRTQNVITLTAENIFNMYILVLIDYISFAQGLCSVSKFGNCHY